MKAINPLLIITFFLCYLLSFEIVYSQDDSTKSKKTHSIKTIQKVKKTDTLQVNQKVKKINDTLYVLVDKAEKKEDIKTLAETLISNNNIALAIMVGIQLLITAAIGYYFNLQTEKYKSKLTKGNDEFKITLTDKTEKYNSELTKENDEFRKDLTKQTDKYRSELDILKNKVQIQFTKLYTEQSEVIKQIYSYIHSCKSARSGLLKIDPNYFIKNEDIPKFNTFSDQVVEAKNFYKKNQILFSDSLCKKIEDYFKLFSSMGDIKKIISNGNQPNLTPQEKEKVKNLFDGQNSEINDVENSTLQSLTQEFRKILGVQDIDNQ